MSVVESIQVLQCYPDRTIKAPSDEPLSFIVTMRAPEGLYAEIWCDIVSHEFPRGGEYAIPLRRDGERFVAQITPSRAGFYTYSLRYRTGSTWHWHGEDGSYEKRAMTQVLVEPAWANTIIYNAFVRQFGAIDRNGDGIIEPGEGGTFADLIDRMDHFVKLGIGAIYLNPISLTGDLFQYKEEIAQHFQDETNHLPVHMHPGSVYSVKDYKSIDPELGYNPKDMETDQYHEFHRFVEECHRRKIRVILDVVFGHTAKDSLLQRLHPEWFLYKEHPHSNDSPYLPYGHELWGHPQHTASPFDHNIHWKDCARLNWEFVIPPAPNEPPKNPRLKEMRAYFKSVLKYWIKNYGVDGFRLDVAYSVPAQFWHDALEECRVCARETWERHASGLASLAPLSGDTIFIGETYVDDVFELQECGITILNGDFSAKIYTVEQLKGYLDYAYNISGDFFPRGSRWMLFPECHDFGRLPAKFQDLRLPDSDRRVNMSRWVLAACLPGSPMLHNGYEVVETRPISVQSYTPIDWQSEKSIIDYIAKVNAVRNESKALQKGQYVFVDSEQGYGADAQLYPFIRDYAHEDVRETVLVIVNMDVNNKADCVKLHLPELDGYDWSAPFELHDLLSGETFERRGNEVNVILEPGMSHVFRIEQKP